MVQDRDPIEFDENNENSIIYINAMQRPDYDKWLEAMKFEIESMKINDVWILVDPPKGIKPMGCKSIFKRKRGTNGKVEIYKAHLVIKDYH